MTDRKLLEYAAKAAGYNMAKVLDGYPMYMEGYGIWNPLADDGDALRLAVKLGIRVCPVTVDGRNAYAAHDRLAGGVGEPHNGDPLAATRRAITRAAAEIGRGIAQQTARAGLPEDNYYKTMAEAEETGRTAAEIGGNK